jgi:hypothetical protein|tara:strand:+ start:47006 stop:47656 length:651 start_codon:yes stop_codon:yes gene_type:complete
MEITEFDKRVYNLYLSSVRSCQNKPYTLRKNFDGFVDDDKFAYLKALSSRFSKTPHLMCKEYFSAPFTLGDEGHFDLKYYSSMRAVGAFSRLSKSSENRPPDEQLDYLKQSFLFIYKFCKDHELKLNDYAYHKSVALEDCLRHIKDHKVSIYVAFSIPSVYTVLVNLEADVFHLYFGDISIVELQRKYERSKVAKQFCQNTSAKIATRVDEFLANL